MTLRRSRSPKNSRRHQKIVVGVSSIAGLGLFIAGVIAVVSPASSKTNISSNLQQVAAAAKVKGYNFVGDGVCVDMYGISYPDIYFNDVPTAEDCAKKCECARDVPGVNYRGFNFFVQPTPTDCLCQVDYLGSNQNAINVLNAACDTGQSNVQRYDDNCGDNDGSGEIKDIKSISGLDSECYELKSKAGKSAKRD